MMLGGSRLGGFSHLFYNTNNTITDHVYLFSLLGVGYNID